MILDGRNRYRACHELGIECPSKLWDGSDPIEYVMRANIHRRHLTPGQRGVLGHKLANLSRGGNGSNQHGTAKTSKKVLAVTKEEAAKLANTNLSAIEARRGSKE
jgi:hypothetical protein